MNNLGVNEIREKYLAFFESKKHLRLSSSSLVPKNDNSLLLINSGMAPLKNYFVGIEVAPSKRVTTCQKCIRTGDIENVGKTARHGTFFEMLGNFSFGDYFKDEIIQWAWEFIINELKMPYEKVSVSVYVDDEETFDIWNKTVGLPKEKIFKMGKDDNFWEVGVGPCGPCTEFYYDRGEEYGCNTPECTVGCDCDRYMEFWNLVFTQFSKEEDGSYSNLEQKNIDTGMGLERMATIMQNVNSIFDVDTIKSIRDKICSIAKINYKDDDRKDVSIRIITDHVRSFAFMIADGILPSNEGRGYVLRRLLRRAVRHGKILGIDTLFLNDITEVVIKNYGLAYPELSEKKDYIYKVVSVEEKNFHETLNQGLDILKDYINEIILNKEIIFSGKKAFKLYDTYGFPVELTTEILEENNLKINLDEFETEMQNQKSRARDARGTSSYLGADKEVYDKIDSTIKCEFLGYNDLKIYDCKVLGLINNNEIVNSVEKGDKIAILLDKTSFYPEGGGQKGDRGILLNDICKIKVNDCIKFKNNLIIHIGEVIEGKVSLNDILECNSSNRNRLSTSRNHTATHILQKVLREYLGNHVEQAGSSVSFDRLRFDFTHFDTLIDKDIMQIEDKVNEIIFSSLDVTTTEEEIDVAKKMGAMALFGEKYDDKVRVVNVSEFSLELCGGTHIKNTSNIGMFKIIYFGGVSSGVKRIEAITGFEALNYFKGLENKFDVLSRICKVNTDNLVKKVENIIDENKKLHQELEKVKSNLSGDLVKDILDKKEIINGFSFINEFIGEFDNNSIRIIGDKIKEKLSSSIIILISKYEGKVLLLVMLTDDVVKSGLNANNIIKEIAKVVDGNGGGRPNMAQASGKDITKIAQALCRSKEVIQNIFG